MVGGRVTPVELGAIGIEIGWGNAIRSYFRYPEQRVKDARTALATSDTNGDIQAFIGAEPRRRATARNEQGAS